MKILVLTKRQCTNKDLIDDKFGRIREIPLGLARCGHEVRGVCLSYVPKGRTELLDVCEKTGRQVKWLSVDIGFSRYVGFLRFCIDSLKVALKFRPDVILPMSDMVYVIWGLVLSKISKSMFLPDIYDLYESYEAKPIPFVLPAYKHSLKFADGIITVSQELSDYLKEFYLLKVPIIVAENGVRQDLFYPKPKDEARKALGIPIVCKAIGIYGSLFRSRNVDTIFSGFEALKKEFTDLHLLLAGTLENGISLPKTDDVHFFGNLPQNELINFICSLDVAIIGGSEEVKFGFPSKTYEIIACGKTPVVSAVGPTGSLFKEHPKLHFIPNSVDSFCSAVRYQLLEQERAAILTTNWDEVGGNISSFMRQIAESKRNQ